LADKAYGVKGRQVAQKEDWQINLGYAVMDLEAVIREKRSNYLHTVLHS
jgi:hypothetical protein